MNLPNLMEGIGQNRIKKRNKRDLTEPVHYEINKKKLSVFTPEFLEENKLIESELRKMRKLNNDFEEYNSVLSHYIEKLTSSYEQATKELKELNNLGETLSTQLTIVKSEAKEKYGIST